MFTLPHSGALGALADGDRLLGTHAARVDPKPRIGRVGSELNARSDVYARRLSLLPFSSRCCRTPLSG